MERKTSFYGHVSPAILEPVSAGDTDEKTKRDNFPPPNPNRPKDELNIAAAFSGSKDKSTMPSEFSYRFNPRLLDLGELLASSNTAEGGSGVTLLITVAGLPKPDEQPFETRECMIYIEKKSIREFPTVTARCGHHTETCRGCATTHIRVTLDNKRWTEIDCPECEQNLTYAEVHKIADAHTFERQVFTKWRESVHLHHTWM